MEQARPPLLEFPCDYPLTIIGRDEGNFVVLIVALVRKHVPALVQSDVTIRPSSANKYISISLSFIAQSQIQLDAIYAELGREPRVLVAL